MEAMEAVSGVDVGRLQVEDRDLPGSPNWMARFTILEGNPDGQFAIRTDPKTNEGVLSVVKVSWTPSCTPPHLAATTWAPLGSFLAGMRPLISWGFMCTPG
jgi:hypothetical protein